MEKSKNKYYGAKYMAPVLIVGGVGLALAIVGGVLIAGSADTVVAVALMTVGVIAMAVAGFIFKLNMDKSRRICDKCGESMQGCAYEYQEKSRKYVDGSANTSGHLEVTVWIRATCPHCGTIKEFTRTFKVDNHSDNLQFQVDNFCRKAFGH